MNNFEKNETLRQLRKMHEKFGQEIAVERKNGALLRYGEIILDIIKNVKEIPATEDCHECSNLVWLKWDVERDGYTIYCPYCGYRMRLCSMCDVRDGRKCDWNSKTGECKNDKR
jgi:DNA-directed RNA polymerase subunit RPC12/RpoP